MKVVQLTFGFAVALGLLIAAVWLWLHNLIIFAAPVGALAIGAAWVTVDNIVIYPAEKARRDVTAGESAESPPAAAPALTAAPPNPPEITAHR